MQSIVFSDLILLKYFIANSLWLQRKAQYLRAVGLKKLQVIAPTHQRRKWVESHDENQFLWIQLAWHSSHAFARIMRITIQKSQEQLTLTISQPLWNQFSLLSFLLWMQRYKTIYIIQYCPYLKNFKKIDVLWFYIISIWFYYRFIRKESICKT